MKKAWFLVAGFLALSAMSSFQVWRLQPHNAEPLSRHTAKTADRPSSLIRSLRPSYPYSVIAGGAYSPEEFRYAHTRDAVVRAHYSDFNVDHVSLVRLTDDRLEYVSYRVKNQVYWTKKKLRIPRGELLLTDGVQYARARCGNRLSDKPHTATNLHEPDLQLSLPPISYDLLPRLDLAEPPGVGGLPTEEPRTTPVEPSPLANLPSLQTTNRPFLPRESIWGSEPLVGRIGYPNFPLTSTPGGTTPGGTTPGGTTPGGTTPGGTTPGGTTPGGSPQPVPTPEPGTVYLCLATLLFGAWAFRFSARKN